VAICLEQLYLTSGLLSQKLCHYLDQGRTVNSLRYCVCTLILAN